MLKIDLISLRVYFNINFQFKGSLFSQFRELGRRGFVRYLTSIIILNKIDENISINSLISIHSDQEQSLCFSHATAHKKYVNMLLPFMNAGVLHHCFSTFSC